MNPIVSGQSLVLVLERIRLLQLQDERVSGTRKYHRRYWANAKVASAFGVLSESNKKIVDRRLGPF